jgi:chemotaxis protein MotB
LPFFMVWNQICTAIPYTETLKKKNLHNMKLKILTVFTLILLLSACVSKKKYAAQLARVDRLKDSVDMVIFKLDQCMADKENRDLKITTLEEEVLHLKATGNALLNQLSELSVITKAQAESIKQSLANLSSKDAYIKDLQVANARKDSINLALVMNLKGALKDVNDEDVSISIEGTAVFVSVSDKLLFSSGSYDLTPRAMEVLGKVADVLKAQPEVRFMVEGHTDNKPISGKVMKDNWDLSVLRATSVVRTLQNYFSIDPGRMIAAGRSEYMPLVPNSSVENRSLNRRTRIVILPELDQFFRLLEGK